MDGSYIIEHYSCCAVSLKHKLDYLCTHADHPKRTGAEIQGTHTHWHIYPHMCKLQDANRSTGFTHTVSTSHTHTHRVQFLFPDNKCHIMVMYSGGPHHIKVAVMESPFGAAGLDMWNQILKLFMAPWSQTASLFSSKQSTGTDDLLQKRPINLNTHLSKQPISGFGVFRRQFLAHHSLVAKARPLPAAQISTDAAAQLQ